MKRNRRPKRNNKYWIEPEIYDNVVTFCRCYPVWVRELQVLPDSNRAIQYDKEKVQTSNNYDATSEIAIRRVETERKINLIQTTAQTVSPTLSDWIIKGVTSSDYTTNDLIQQGMPASRNHYTNVKQHFYYLLSKRI